MKTIWKYELETTDYQLLSIPLPAKILSVSSQGNQIVLYAEIDTKSMLLREVAVWIHGTGHEKKAYDTSTFIGTVKLLDGALMFHVFVA